MKLAISPIQTVVKIFDQSFVEEFQDIFYAELLLFILRLGYYTTESFSFYLIKILLDQFYDLRVLHGHSVVHAQLI